MHFSRIQDGKITILTVIDWITWIGMSPSSVGTIGNDTDEAPFPGTLILYIAVPEVSVEYVQ